MNGSYVSFRMKYLTENGLRFENGDRLIDQGTYLFHKLTGAFLESRSMASGTGLLSLRALDWDPELASEMGVPLAALPSFVSMTAACRFAPAPRHCLASHRASLS